jgi:hypothetical protein
LREIILATPPFSINDFDSGIYFYRIMDFSGKERMDEKFIVKRK